VGHLGQLARLHGDAPWRRVLRYRLVRGVGPSDSLRLRQVFGFEAGHVGDDFPGDAVLAQFASALEFVRLNALLETSLHPDFDSFLSPPIDDFRHVSLLEPVIQIVLLHCVQSTLDDPEGKQESNAIRVSGLEKGEGIGRDPSPCCP